MYTEAQLLGGGDVGSHDSPPPPHHLSFRTKQGPKVSVSNITDIAFNECSEIMQTRNFTIFTVYVTSFRQFMAAFHFFYLHRENRSLPIGPFKKVLYLTLGLLESSLLWTIRRETIVNESLNVRSQAESWVYQKSPRKQEKHPS